MPQQTSDQEHQAFGEPDLSAWATPQVALRRIERAALCAQLRAAHQRLWRFESAEASLAGRGGFLPRLDAAEAFFRQRLALWLLDCSMAHDVSYLRGEGLAVLRALRNWQFLFHALLRRRCSLPAPPDASETLLDWPFDLHDPGHYRALLHVLCLCRIFDQPAVLRRLALGLGTQAGMDGLLAHLLNLPGTWPAPPAPFNLLLDLRGADRDAAELGEAVARYLGAMPVGHVDSGCEVLALLPMPRGLALQPLHPCLPWRLLQSGLKQAGPSLAKARRHLQRKVPRGLGWRFHHRSVWGRSPAARRRSHQGQKGWQRGIAALVCLAGTHAQLALAEGLPRALGATTTTRVQPWVEHGLASWYGPGFQDRATANGERYDMHGLSAAHRSLPMSSFVLVRNLRNQRQVVVAINDRGPFVEGRILDLSYAAARQLGMIEPGVVDVEISLLSEVQLWQLHEMPVGMSERSLGDGGSASAALPSFMPDAALLGGLAQLAGAPPVLNVPEAPAEKTLASLDANSPAHAMAAAHLGGLAGFERDRGLTLEAKTEPGANLQTPPQATAVSRAEAAAEPRLWRVSLDLPAGLLEQHLDPLSVEPGRDGLAGLAVPSHLLLGLHLPERPDPAGPGPASPLAGNNHQALRNFAPGLLGFLGHEDLSLPERQAQAVAELVPMPLATSNTAPVSQSLRHVAAWSELSASAMRPAAMELPPSGLDARRLRPLSLSLPWFDAWPSMHESPQELGPVSPLDLALGDAQPAQRDVPPSKRWEEPLVSEKRVAEPVSLTSVIDVQGDVQELPSMAEAFFPRVFPVQDDATLAELKFELLARMPRPLLALPSFPKRWASSQEPGKQAPATNTAKNQSAKPTVMATAAVAAAPSTSLPSQRLAAQEKSKDGGTAKGKNKDKAGLLDTLVKLTRKGWQGLSSLLGFESKRDNN